jgi:EAL domain-containing protein (putative c-di-GMP-specific phosphodiesterase class I)
MKNRVIFELLETDSFDKVGRIEEFIKEMKQLGSLIAIDDFGTGYSNFAYLMKLNVDIIKIDGSIIKNIDVDKSSEIITKTIVNFSKDLGLSTVAEFVHSNSVFNKVRDLGVDFSQGFFIGKPSDILV